MVAALPRPPGIAYPGRVLAPRLVPCLILLALAGSAGARGRGGLEDAPAPYDLAAFSRGARRVASVGQDGRHVRLEARESTRIGQHLTAHSRPLTALALSRDGGRVASADDSGTVVVRDAGTGEGHLLVWHREPVRALALSPGGRLLASAAPPERGVVLWDTVRGRRLHVLRAGERAPRALAFSPDSRRLLLGLEGAVVVLDVWRGVEEARLPAAPEGVTGLAVSEDGTRAASGSALGFARVHDLEAGTTLATFPGHVPAAHAAAFSPDARRLALAGQPGHVQIWDLETEDLVLEERVPATRLGAVEFLPGGRRVAWAGGNYRGVVEPPGPGGSG